jgi:CDP-4-dehydro-6-deoxyglucose reductase
MSRITFIPEGGESRDIDLSAGESVLDGLLRGGILVPNSCRSGVCQSCLMQAAEGTAAALTVESQKGLKDAQRARGLFMACACKPTADLAVRFAADAARASRAIVRRVEKVGRDVARVTLACEHDAFNYYPGQFVNVVRPDGLTRSYSLASLHSPAGLPAGDEFLELHVRKIDGGRMSTWLHDEAREGDAVSLRGPLGDCFYVPGKPEQPILLIGTGTGLAPLYAIARDALRHGHAGPIRLYHGAVDPSGLYLVDELIQLAGRHANFTYTPCVLTGPAAPGVRVGPIDRVVFSDHPKLAGQRVFLCGDPGLVNALRKKVYLAGARMKDIYADAFVTRASA